MFTTVTFMSPYLHSPIRKITNVDSENKMYEKLSAQCWIKISHLGAKKSFIIIFSIFTFVS